MTKTQWGIVAFWVVMLLVGAFYFLDYSAAPPPPVVPEKHWFPPPLPGSAPPVPSADADVRLLRYVPHVAPGAMSFTADVIIKNFGQKKATGVSVRIQPYVGNLDTNKKAIGPDEIPNQEGGDPLVNVAQWVNFSDLGPGETATQTVTLPMRSDADPAGTFKPQITFETAKP